MLQNFLARIWMNITDYINKRKEVHFSTELAFGKIAAKKEASVVAGTGFTTHTIPHGLSKAPLIVGYMLVPGVGNVWVPIWSPENNFPTASMQIAASAGDTNIRFIVRNSSGSNQTIYFRVWCYYV